MELKHPIFFYPFLFSILGLSLLWIYDPMYVQAFTVCDLLHNNNVTASEIQQAVDNGSILYSDLPGAYQVNIHAQGVTVSHPTKSIVDNSMPCDQSKQDNSWVSIMILVAVALIPLVFLFGSGRLSFRHDNYHDTPDMTTLEDNEKIKPKLKHPPLARILLALGIIRVKKK